MPVYHSSFNLAEVESICGYSILPLRPAVPPPPVPGEPPAAVKADIVDEAITFFRANVMFKSFEVKGGADRVLVYLTMFIHQCLKKIEKCRNKGDAIRLLAPLARDDTFPIPGAITWFFGATFPAGAAADRLRAFFRQAREAAATRLLGQVFHADDSPNKFWLAFAKRSFMSKEM